MPVRTSRRRLKPTTCGVTMSRMPVIQLLGVGHLQHKWACKDVAAPIEQHGEHAACSPAKQAACWLLESQGQPLHCACPVHSRLSPAASFLQPASQQLTMWLGRLRQVTNSGHGHRSLPHFCLMRTSLCLPQSSAVPLALAARAEALLHNQGGRASLQPGCLTPAAVMSLDFVAGWMQLLSGCDPIALAAQSELQ